jgi:phage terminase large subunit-like protein
LEHGGNPVLRFNASCVMVEEDPAGNIKPSKRKSTGRIDGIVAGVMAIGRAIVAENFTSVYEERGLLSL